MVSLRMKSALLLSLIIFINGCSGGEMESNSKKRSSIREIPNSAWENLSQKRIYFGHQSVGYNIMDGVGDVVRENAGIKIKVAETKNKNDFDGPIFAHSTVGSNFNSKSKDEDFLKTIEDGIGEKVDIAFFKYCFVDFDENTDTNATMQQYRKTMSDLQIKYPKVKFVHMTTPLTGPPAGLVNQIKRLVKIVIGRPVVQIEENIPREEFNNLLRKEYDGKEPVFDLAEVQSTFPDGTKSTFSKNGKTYFTIVPEYTYDGGHLNELGRGIVGEKLLIFLSKL